MAIESAKGRASSIVYITPFLTTKSAIRGDEDSEEDGIGIHHQDFKFKLNQSAKTQNTKKKKKKTQNKTKQKKQNKTKQKSNANFNINKVLRIAMTVETKNLQVGLRRGREKKMAKMTTTEAEMRV